MSFENMTLDDYFKFQKLIRELALVKDHVNEVSTNGAHKDYVEKIYAVGWRKSEFEKNLYFQNMHQVLGYDIKMMVSQYG